MKLSEYSQFDATGLAELVSSKQVTSAELAQTAQQAIESVNGRLNALALPLFTEPLEHSSDGPLAGVPFLIKDDGPKAAGVPFQVGSRFLDGSVASDDNYMVERFKRAGLAVLGVTTAPEMAINFATESKLNGATSNPWDLTKGTGGSSGGAAALVAAGAVPVAEGSDGAGSIRIPASSCGVVGLKPSRGRTPVGPGTIESLFGIGYYFALTRTVRDTARLLDCVHGYAPGEKYGAPVAGGPYIDNLSGEVESLRVGVTTTPWSVADVHPECAASATAVAMLLGEMGHRVEQAKPEVEPESILDSYVPITTAFIGSLIGTNPERASTDFLENVSLSIYEEYQSLKASDLVAGLGAFNSVSRSVGTFFESYDLLITPTLGQLPPPHWALNYDQAGHTMRSWMETILAHGPFTAVFNISGQPAISLPVGMSSSGLPIGVQIVAPFGREDLLIRVAAKLEEAMPWKDRAPSVHVAGAVQAV